MLGLFSHKLAKGSCAQGGSSGVEGGGRRYRGGLSQEREEYLRQGKRALAGIGDRERGGSASLSCKQSLRRGKAFLKLFRTVQ